MNCNLLVRVREPEMCIRDRKKVPMRKLMASLKKDIRQTMRQPDSPRKRLKRK